MIKYIHKVKLSGKEKNVINAINDQYIIPFVTCNVVYQNREYIQWHTN